MKDIKIVGISYGVKSKNIEDVAEIVQMKIDNKCREINRNCLIKYHFKTCVGSTLHFNGKEIWGSSLIAYESDSDVNNDIEVCRSM